MNKIDIPMSDPSYKAKEKILEWHSKLHRMKAVDVLNDTEIRQLKLDLYTSLMPYRGLGPKGSAIKRFKNCHIIRTKSKPTNSCVQSSECHDQCDCTCCQ